MQVQLVYVMSSGREYRTMPFPASEGTELQDVHNRVKYQLTMDSYPIEFTNDRGDSQVIMARNVETIVVRIIGQVAPEPAPVYEENLEEFATHQPVAVGGATATQTKFDLTYKVPTQHVYVSDSEKTQEINIPVVVGREPSSDAGSAAPDDDGSEEPARRAYAPRRRANSRRSGRGSGRR